MPTLAISRIFKKTNLKFILILCSIILVLLFSFLIRRNTFWLAHWQGDQSHYVCLAMKLDRFGIDGYNLRGIKINDVVIHKKSGARMVFPTCPDPNQEGELLMSLKDVGFGYYDQPLFWKTPLLPYILSLSHRFFAKPNQPFSIVATNIGKIVKKLKPDAFFKAQFYACLVPLIFDLMTILLVFFIGQKLFTARIGIYASILMATNAISIWISHRIWTESLLVFFLVFSVWLFLIAKDKRSLILYVLSGIFCGLAILSKQTGILAVMPILLLSIGAKSLTARKSGNINKDSKIEIFNMGYLIFIIFTLLIAAPWFIKVFQVYGNPFFAPHIRGMIETDMTQWSSIIEKRPAPIILFGIGTFYLSPLFVLAYFTLGIFFKEVDQLFKNVRANYNFVFLWTWVIVFFMLAILVDAKEHRYVYPAYPALALLSAFFIDKLRRLYLNKFHNHLIVAEVLVAALFILNAARSVPLGVEAAIQGRILMRIPF